MTCRGCASWLGFHMDTLPSVEAVKRDCALSVPENKKQSNDRAGQGRAEGTINLEIVVLLNDHNPINIMCIHSRTAKMMPGTWSNITFVY